MQKYQKEHCDEDRFWLPAVRIPTGDNWDLNCSMVWLCSGVIVPGIPLHWNWKGMLVFGYVYTMIVLELEPEYALGVVHILRNHGNDYSIT